MAEQAEFIAQHEQQFDRGLACERHAVSHRQRVAEPTLGRFVTDRAAGGLPRDEDQVAQRVALR